MRLLFAGSGDGRAVAVVELKGAIAIAVVEHLAPSVLCVPEMSDSDHDASARGIWQCRSQPSSPLCHQSQPPSPPVPPGFSALASPNECPGSSRSSPWHDWLPKSFKIEYSAHPCASHPSCGACICHGYCQSKCPCCCGHKAGCRILGPGCRNSCARW